MKKNIALSLSSLVFGCREASYGVSRDFLYACLARVVYFPPVLLVVISLVRMAYMRLCLGKMSRMIVPCVCIVRVWIFDCLYFSCILCLGQLSRMFMACICILWMHVLVVFDSIFVSTKGVPFIFEQCPFIVILLEHGWWRFLTLYYTLLPVILLV